MTGASRPSQEMTAWPRLRRTASLSVMASAGMSSSAVATESNASSAPRPPEVAALVAQLLKFFQRNHVGLAEWPDRQPAERGDMGARAEFSAHIPGKRTDIRALAALGLENRMVGVGVFHEIKAVDVDQSRLQLDDLTLAGEIVGAFAGDFYGRELRRDLHDCAGELRQDGRGFLSALGRPSEVAAAVPSMSSVVVSTPQPMVKR